MNHFERFLCWHMKLADFLVSKNSTWGPEPLEEYWQSELIVTHPFRILLNSLILFPIAFVCALAGWLGVLGGVYFVILGVVTLMPPHILVGLFLFFAAYVLACLCTAYVAKHLLMLTDFLILFFRHQDTVGSVTSTELTRSGTPATPVKSWHIRVLAEINPHTKEKQKYYGRTQITWLHDRLEPGLMQGSELCIRFDPKRPQRARVLY